MVTVESKKRPEITPAPLGRKLGRFESQLGYCAADPATQEVKLYPETGSIPIADLPEDSRLGPQMIQRSEAAGRAPEPVYGVLDEALELLIMQLGKQYMIAGTLHSDSLG